MFLLAPENRHVLSQNFFDFQLQCNIQICILWNCLFKVNYVYIFLREYQKGSRKSRQTPLKTPTGFYAIESPALNMGYNGHREIGLVMAGH